MNALDIEAKCKEIYREAQEFFHKNPSPFNSGFKILNSPPHYRPPVMFIEYQPNGSDDDFKRGTSWESDKQ